jgi:Type I phosphodiesterase / nucleotide pyrophosphatase
MASKWKFGCLTAAFMLFVLSDVHAGPKPPRPQEGGGQHIRHVLLISIDGMHAVDYAYCVAHDTCPTLAQLGEHGVNYTRTSTSRPSDSFPGLMALVTGGTPRTVGAFYDVAYDRVLAPPKVDTGNGLPAGDCVTNQIHQNSDGSTGTQTEYEEGVEIDQTKLNGGGAFTGPNALIDGGVISINPDRLERDPFNGCKPVYPWNFVRTNTIYGVIHAAGGYTAWSDKHAVYAVVSGPTGTSTPSNVDDYYSPEVNSNKIPLPGLTTAGTNYDCGGVVNDGNDWTTDFDAIKCYDQLKANAVVNWINGEPHLGGMPHSKPVPVIFGMNFQAVSVGQKLISPAALPADRSDSNSGGYEDAQGTPRPLMMKEIQFVDAAIGQMVSALKNQGLLDSTAIIITAKHGQSPIDPNRFFPIPGKTNPGTNSPGGVVANLLPVVYNPPAPVVNGLGLAEDDISQIWLAHPSDTATAVGDLETANTPVGLGQILYGTSLTTLFNPPGLPEHPGPCCKLREGGDPRTPDIVVLTNVGVVYTGNDKKQSEHGGYAWDDTNVMLLVSNPGLEAKTVHAFVETPQVAPTILQLLGLNPSALDAVKSEGTAVLPDLVFGGGD